MNLETWFTLGMKREQPALIVPGYQQFDLGCGNNPVPGAIALDWPAWTAPEPIPAADRSVDTIWAHHFMEHLTGADAISMLREIQRVLKIGGSANIVTPYYNSQLQSTDLDHKSAYCEETWRNLFSNEMYAKNHDGWALKVNVCWIIGIKERNLALFTQLVRWH